MAKAAPSIREALETSLESAGEELPEKEEKYLPELDNPVDEISVEPEREETPQREAKAEPQAELTAEHAKAQPAVEGRPPIDWDVNLKQEWRNVPPKVREYITQRNHSVDQLMQQTAAARKFSDEVVRTLEPYRAVMAAEGVQNPLQAIDGLMRITATLQMGSPQQKAQAISNLVKHYGIDIETLDSALVGQLPGPDPQQTRLEQMLEQRMAPVNQLLQQVNQANSYQQEQLYGSAHQSIAEFASDPRNEFIDDVRLDMADMLEMAAQRGRPLTLAQAYNIACANHEQIGPILAQRGNPAQQAARKRAASSSLASGGSPGSAPASSSNLRDTIAAQFSDDRI